MSEGSLVNRYRQYKAGTSKIVTWLAQTARRARDVTSILPSLKPANDAAKQAKRAKSGPTSDTNVKITTTQLLSLAQVIVDAALPISDEILRTIRIVITGREGCASFYESVHATSEQQTSNDGHQHFIKVLKDILHLFEASKRIVPSTRAHPKPSDRCDDLTNVFDLLQIDEPSANPLGSAPTKSNKVVTFELESPHDEKTFAIWCLLQDFRELRQELSSLWLDYQKGGISFDNVSMITMVGLDLWYSAQKEFANQHPDLGSYPALLEHLNLVVGTMFNDVFICPDEGKSLPAATQIKTDEIPELLCPRAWVIVIGFLQVLGRKIGRNHGPDGLRNTGESWLDVHALGQALKSRLPWFVAMGRLKESGRERSDGFLATLHTFADNPDAPPPVWVKAVCQIHMDIYEVIGSTVDHKLLMIEARLTTDLERIQRLRQILIERFKSQPKHVLVGDCDALIADFERMRKDPYQQFASKALDPSQQGERDTPESFPVHRIFPMTLGKNAYGCAVAVHNRGVTCCDVGKMVLSAAYLYRAARIIGAITKPWTDMEHVIQIQNRVHSFVLEADSVTSVAKFFGLSLGMKPQSFRRGQRPPPPNIAFVDRNAKNMLVDWPMVTRVRVSSNDEKINVPQDITPIVQTGVRSIERLRKLGLCSQRLGEIHRQLKKTGKLTTTQLLIGMKETANADETDLNFDYIGFSDDCFNLLRVVIDRCTPDAMLPAAPTTPTDGTMPVYEAVYSILWHAVAGSDSDASIKRSKLYQAGALMENMIQNRGSKHMDLAHEKIEKLRRPAAALTEDSEASDKRTEDEDRQLMLYFFGLPSAKVQKSGVFCSCKEEADARANVIKLQILAGSHPEVYKQEELWRACCKVMGFTVGGIVKSEQAKLAQRLQKVLKARMPEIFAGLELEKVLATCGELSLRCAAGEGRVASYEDRKGIAGGEREAKREEADKGGV